MTNAEGQPFGKYRLLDRLAAGGMAEIYKARLTAAAGVTKQVVIKKILPAYAGNRNFISMFINEAKIVVSLSHGNIAQVFDFGEIDGEYFLAMEFVDGQTLAKVMRRAREKGIPVLPTPFAVLIAMEMCKGLHYAHTRLDHETGKPLGIVHRDVSPQNVILSYEGQVKIVDFGIAKARTAGRTETEAGAVKGKYVYFAPEQARGKELDGRTDVFATGIVLYEMLCGRLPFEGKMIDVLSKIVKADFVRPREINPDITPALERIVMTAMSLERNDRYASAQDFQQALAGYLYANAPTFGPDQLQRLLSYLYEPELVDAGRPVQIPRDFAEQIQTWQKQLSRPAEPETSIGVTSLARSKPGRGQKADDELEQTRTDSPQSRERKVSPRSRQSKNQDLSPRLPLKALFIGAPVAAALIAGILVVVLGHFSRFSIELTSVPSAAQVRIDGQPASTLTPVHVSGLSASQEHVVEVSAPGMKTWRRPIKAQGGQTVAVVAELEPDRPPLDLSKPSRPSAPAEEEGAPKVLSAGDLPLYEQSWPQDRFSVEPSRHAFNVASSRAARVRLLPKKSYKVWVEGQVSLGGGGEGLSIDRCFFALEGKDVPSDESFGLLGSRPLVVQGAQALYAFIVDSTDRDNSGAFKVRIQETQGGAVTTLIVDAKEHAAELSPAERFTLSKLDPFQSYALTLRPGADPARLRPGKSGAVGHVLLVQNAGFKPVANKGVVDNHRVLEVGKKYEVSGATTLQFTFPDGSKVDNGGALSVELSSAGP